MIDKIEKCCGKFCLLSFVYPGGDANLACDSACNRDESPKSHDDWYLENYPEQVEGFNLEVRKDKESKKKKRRF